ncbi:MAG: hypothetical protein ACKPHU_12845, partial [Planctomycetaceae bacterium]
MISSAQDSVLIHGEGLHGPWQWQADHRSFGDFPCCQFLPAGGSEERQAREADQEQPIAVVHG